MMHLEYKYRNNLKGWRWVAEIFIGIFIIFVIIYLYFEITDWKTWKLCLLYVLFWFLFYAIPLLILDIRYYLRNRGQVIDVLDDRLILLQQNGERKEYLFSEMDEVLLYRSKTIEAGGGFTLSPMDYYCYLKFEFKDIDEPPVYITCFMHPDLDEVSMKLKGVGMSIHRSVF